MPVDKTRMLNRRKKRKLESRRLRDQKELLKAKKDTLRKLFREGRLPRWIQLERDITE